MTQVASPATVLGNFDNVTLSLDGEPILLQRRGDEFLAEMIDPDWKHDLVKARLRGQPLAGTNNPPRVWKRITMLTGSHHMQAYWVPSRRGNVQFGFPFAWLIQEQRWAPRKDTFIRDPDAASPIQIWNLNCIQCHSTGGQPGEHPTTKVVNSRVGEFGIACESCHGPAEEHVRANANPLRRYFLHGDNGGDPTITNPARISATRSSQLCGQCHAIRANLHHEEWRQTGSDFRPGDDLAQHAQVIHASKLIAQSRLRDASRLDPTLLQNLFWPDGMVRVTGREYNGLIDTPCHTRGELSCLSCHSMHDYDDRDDQLAARMNSNLACLQCHSAFESKLQEHTHHAASSAGSLCYNCHMPHTTYGLLKAVRSHQIDSPRVKASLETGRPNACNLCHLDQTLEWASTWLSKWFGHAKIELAPEEQRVSAALLWLLKGDAAQRAVVAWHMGWEPARTASGDRWQAPFLATLLAEEPYAAVRSIAYQSLKSAPGFAAVAYDFTGNPPERKDVARHVFDSWNALQTNRLDRADDKLLIGPAGILDRKAVDQLLQRRNNRMVELVE